MGAARKNKPTQSTWPMAALLTAGLWSLWKLPQSGEEILTCTMMTCEPNKVMGELHDRMPVILAERD
jgi:putative SOS response-associated peptidase YedK